MACFIVPMVQAIVTTAIRRHSSNRYLPTLETMLWGGTIMLIVDHIINGEITWTFPFFTALTQTGGWGIMLREMLTVGVPMSLVITAVWGIWALVKSRRSITA